MNSCPLEETLPLPCIVLDVIVWSLTQVRSPTLPLLFSE